MLDITREAAGYAAKFGYDAELIAALKDAVPRRWRRWDPERKAWLFSFRGWPTAERVFQQFGLLEGDQAPPDKAWRTLYLQPGAPAELVVSAYRTLAKLKHPDKGGTNEEMKRLNLAYENLQGRQ